MCQRRVRATTAAAGDLEPLFVAGELDTGEVSQLGVILWETFCRGAVPRALIA